MTMLPADCPAMSQPDPTGLERLLRYFSVVTMAMTVPQVLAIWVERNSAGVSLSSWATYFLSACLWLVYGIKKRDRTIYLACIGWIVLDAAIVVGVIVQR